MKMLKFLLLFLIVASVTFENNAQEVLKAPKYPDGVYIKENTRTRRAIPYPHLREADVMWSKRVWRVIDLREKMNHPLYYPDAPILDRKSLFDVIKDASMLDGTITLFDQPLTDDEFRFDMTKSEIEKLLVSWDSTATTEDPSNPGTYISAPTKNEITTLQVWKYWVKEDWFFDKQRSVLDVRIIGICPLIEKRTETGESTGADKPLFWVYFPEARPIFANQEVYMRHNDAERRTLEDIFWKRMFSSYVRKESNVYNRGIFDYKTGLDQLLEAERVKEDIFKYEHDLFHF
ncbi:MAG: gliding motility protein GldN [Bacteroidota bacterium]|nr:gliding motility protein GldN [Bacteroidota bacterium]